MSCLIDFETEHGFYILSAFQSALSIKHAQIEGRLCLRPLLPGAVTTSPCVVGTSQTLSANFRPSLFFPAWPLGICCRAQDVCNQPLAR